MGYKVFEKAMKGRKLTQTSIAKVTGIPQQSLSAWKTGRFTPNMDRLQILADYLNLDVNDLAKADSDVIIERTASSTDDYYINPSTAKIAQEIFENPELHALFDSARDADPDDLRTAHSVLLALKRKGQ